MTDPQRRPTRWTPLAAALLLGACANAGEPPHIEERLLVKLARPSDDAAAIAAAATRVAGRPVRYAAAVSPAWHAVVVSCPDRASCADALRALRAAPEIFERADPDTETRALRP